MNTNELNNYIKHYIEKDKTQSALMLTAPWGTGKSYYINNYLVPFLNDNCGKKCIIVSLYGLKDTKDISKSIFLEAKMKPVTKNSVGANAGKIIAKTVVKGVASFFGVNLDVNEEDLNKLYSSIDLSNKLIILEDVERSQIDILELLGYVNNLVEQDGVKVLLVTNEEELLHYRSDIDPENNEKKVDILAEESANYLKIKEKTISDTIMFYSSNKAAICSIIEKFNDKRLNGIICDDTLDEIGSIMEKTNCANLRSFIFGCQKTIDIFEKVDFSVDDDFFKNVFLSNIAFCLKRKNNDGLKWSSEDSTSEDLGTYRYPLYRFSYDYICSQYLDGEEIRKCNSDYCAYKARINVKNELSPYFDVIYSYYLCSEEEVTKAVLFILEKLRDTNDIPLDDYGKLANYLIAIKYDLGCNSIVDECKNIMLSKLSEISNNTMDRIIFHNGIQLESADALEELNQFKDLLKNKININNLNKLDFDYSKEKITEFCDYVYNNKDLFIGKRCFARKIDNEKFVSLLKKCSASEIHELRGIFHAVYSFSNIKDFFVDDKDSLEDLKIRIEELIEGDNSFDKIQKKQIRYLINNLEELVSRLSR